MANPTPYLTPSELIYLNGEKFAPQAGVFNKVRLMQVDLEVNLNQLVTAMVAAAFLVNEQYQALYLALRSKKVLLGLASAQALYADPGGLPPQWPARTLEADLPLLAAQAAPRGQNEVYALIYYWLGADSASPFNAVIDRVREGLANRMLLEVHEEKKLKIFTVRKFTLPESTRALAASQSPAPVQQIFQYTQQNRPDLWKKLHEEIKRAISARQEKSDDTSFDD